MRVSPELNAPREYPTTLYLNDAELLTIQTTPVDLQDWAWGFMFAEGLIREPGAIKRVVVDEDRGVVWVDAPGVKPPDPDMDKRYITSGCGKGVTFTSIKDATQLRPLTSDLKVTLEQLQDWIRRMNEQTPLFDVSGGMHHATVVPVETGEMKVREDIGRHNAVDKAIGAAARAGWDLRRCVILTSGRISYEMCSKMGRCGLVIGATRTAVTDMAVRLANNLGIELVGYVRGNKAVVYTQGVRIE